MAPVQMNVRIEQDLKNAGDAAFEDIGYTPTEVVREVWGFAKRNRRNRRALNDLMRTLRDPREEEADEEARTRREAEFEEWLARGPGIVRDYCTHSGIDHGSIPRMTALEYDELLGDGLLEEYEQGGRIR